MKLTPAAIEGFINQYLLVDFAMARPVSDFHRQWLEMGCLPDRNVALAAPRGHAKAQPLGCRVLTPSGWTTIGALRKGDFVIGSSGEPVQVCQVHPIAELDVYEVMTRDGRKTRCNVEHLWQVIVPSNTGARRVVKPLREILKNYKTARFDKRDGSENIECRYWLPLGKPVRFLENNPPIDPYLLGVWLGDGHSAGARITSADPEIFESFPANHVVKKQSGKYLYGISDLQHRLRAAGVLNNKHVPDYYLRGSIHQRLSLLQGLMDTDGTVHQDKRIAYFGNTNYQLIRSVVDLVRGLGGVAAISIGSTKLNGEPYQSWIVSVKLPNGLSPFRLKRKNALIARGDLKVAIVDIAPAGKELCRCITVAAKDGIYLTDDYIPTHNSTLYNVSYSLSAAMLREQPFQLKISRNRGLAVEFLRTVKDILKQNQKLIEDFGVTGFERDTEDDFICVLEDGYKFRMSALGFEQNMRGTTWGTRRPGLVICDDIEDPEAVLSKERLEKNMHLFMGTLKPMGNVDTLFRVIGTVLGAESLLQQFIESPAWTSRVYEACDDTVSPESILWPEMYPHEYWVQKKQEYASTNNLIQFNMEYRNIAVDMTSGFFQRTDFREADDADAGKRKTYYVGVDYAISAKERRDYTTMAVGGLDDEGYLHVEDFRRGRWDGKEILDEMFSIEEAFHPELWFVESGAIQKALGAALELEQRSRNVYLNLRPMVPTKDKQSRARSIQARMRSHAVRFDKRHSWFANLENEMLQFPRGRHDDQVDGMALLGLGLANMVAPPTDQEAYDMEYQRGRQNRDESFEFGMGRNSHTGY